MPATPSPSGVLLAFDFGEVRIGVAVGNTITGGARPLTVLASVPVAQRFAAIAELIREWSPNALVVGRPVHPDGQAHAMTARCERFARQLEGRFSLSVVLEDERYTSALAPGETSVDAEAAAILLQGFLHAQIHPDRSAG